MAGDRLHELTHRIPGVPPHRVRGPGHHGSAQVRERREHPAGVNRRHTREPRVLVRWQRWIASLPSRRQRSR